MLVFKEMAVWGLNAKLLISNINNDLLLFWKTSQNINSLSDSNQTMLNALKYNREILLLTHCGLVTTYGGIDLGQHWLR